MPENELTALFIRFGLTGLLGFLIGLEREIGAGENPHTGMRDFVMFALIGATSAQAATLFDNSWLIAVGFFGVLSMVVSGYWFGSTDGAHHDGGITTEIAALLTFFVGVLVMGRQAELAIALTIVLLAVLSQKHMAERLSSGVQRYELDAVLKFLIISFIVLPVLPNRALDTYLTLPVGTVTAVEEGGPGITIAPVPGFEPEAGEVLDVYTDALGGIGELRVSSVAEGRIEGRIEGVGAGKLTPGEALLGPMAGDVVATLLSALRPYKVWLIVVLVSFISFVGYLLIKVLGSAAGIGLTGLVGGLASSTVTTLSFARRSKETPAWNRNFAVAVILASSVMFPRLLVQISVVNQALMRNSAVPILVMGATGIVVAVYFYLRSRSEHVESQEVSFTNPFSLKSAVTFGLVFSVILMVTRLAITYLGDAWLPVVAIVSGLTDADAIAFSLSDAQQAGLISLDWASFNLVLGALSNTFMKLFLIFTLGDRGLFRRVLLGFLIIGGVGLVTMFLYYDISAIAGAGA